MLRGHPVMRGYLISGRCAEEEPDGHLIGFRNGWFDTGDLVRTCFPPCCTCGALGPLCRLVRLDNRQVHRLGTWQGHVDDGSWLYVTGRVKDVINRGGETIAPIEIEEVRLSFESHAFSPRGRRLPFCSPPLLSPPMAGRLFRLIRS